MKSPPQPLDAVGQRAGKPAGHPRVGLNLRRSAANVKKRVLKLRRRALQASLSGLGKWAWDRALGTSRSGRGQRAWGLGLGDFAVGQRAEGRAKGKGRGQGLRLGEDQ